MESLPQKEIIDVNLASCNPLRMCCGVGADGHSERSAGTQLLPIGYYLDCQLHAGRRWEGDRHAYRNKECRISMRPQTAPRLAVRHRANRVCGGDSPHAAAFCSHSRNHGRFSDVLTDLALYDISMKMYKFARENYICIGSHRLTM